MYKINVWKAIGSLINGALSIPLWLTELVIGLFLLAYDNETVIVICICHFFLFIILSVVESFKDPFIKDLIQEGVLVRKNKEMK